MARQNPQLTNKIKQMMQGKNETQLRELVENVAKERGVDINKLAGQLGLKL